VATLQDIRKRIEGVEKTQKITRAMKTVSTAKLGRSTKAIAAARPYAEKIREVLAAVAAGGVDPDAHPLLVSRDAVKRLDVVLFTSDRGLCGAFNSNLIRRAEELIVRRQPELDSVSIIPVGRKGGDYFRRRSYGDVPRDWTGLGQASQESAREIAAYLMERYVSGEADEAVLVYSRFQSALTQVPCDQLLLPVASPEGGASPEGEATAAGAAGEHERHVYEIEPDPVSLLGLLVPAAVEFAVFRALLESEAGEHGARMTAMDNATKNTEELVESLTLTFNKARQSAITAELVEIVSGAEAL
jgi:F-type H+-transporting ATPase subunit gamma